LKLFIHSHPLFSKPTATIIFLFRFLTQLAARGIVTEDLLKHWIFVTEYQWVVMAGGDEAAKGIAVIDVGTVKMGDLAGDNLEYVRKTIGYANAHYPERSYVIYLVNAPYWFSLLWQIVRPMVHPNTQAKVRILTKGATLKGLQEHIDISNIPEFYGGQLDFGGHDSCRFQSPEVVELNNFVQRVNEGMPQPKNNFDENVINSSPSPPGRPGEHYNSISTSRSTDSLASRSVVELDSRVNSLQSARASGVRVQSYPSDSQGIRRSKQG
jgi:CRAL/TRIO domain